MRNVRAPYYLLQNLKSDLLQLFGFQLFSQDQIAIPMS